MRAFESDFAGNFIFYPRATCDFVSEYQPYWPFDVQSSVTRYVFTWGAVIMIIKWFSGVCYVN